MFPYHNLRIIMGKCYRYSFPNKYWSVLTAIILLSPLANNANYIYYELNGTIKHSEWNISLLTKNFEGIVLYATNANASFLIKLHSDNRIGTVTLNEMDPTSRTMINCAIEPINHLTILISFNSKRIILNCRNATNSTLLASDVEDQFKNLPLPKDYYKATNKTFIWMGNIGLYVGYNNETFNPLKSQLIGCVEYFYFNNQPIALKNQNNQIVPSCTSQTVTEHVNNRTMKSSRSINVQMYDCSLPGINANRCYPIELPVFKESNQSYHRYENNNYNKTIKISLVWKQLYSKEFCLMEIKLRNGTIIFVVNNINVVSMHMYNTDADTNLSLISLDKISLDKINKLSMAFGISEFMVKIFNGIQIHKFITDSIGAPIKINVGKSRKKQICRTFEGILGFQYDSSDFTRSGYGNMKATGHGNNSVVVSFIKPNNNKDIWILIGGFSIVIAALFTIYWVFRKQMKRRFKEINRDRSEPMHYEVVDNIYTISPPIRESCDYGMIESEYASIK